MYLIQNQPICINSCHGNSWQYKMYPTTNSGIKNAATYHVELVTQESTLSISYENKIFERKKYGFRKMSNSDLGIKR